MLAWRLDVGLLSEPGPGFFPLWSAAFLALLAAVLAVLNVRGLRAWERRSRLGDVFNRRTAVCLAAFAAYVATLRLLGFVPSSFLLFLVLTGVVGRSGWRTRLLVSLAAVTLFWVVFEHLLELNLPAGRLVETLRD